MEPYTVESYQEHDEYTQRMQPRFRVVDPAGKEVVGGYDRGQQISARARAAELNGAPLAGWLLGRPS